MATRIRPDPLLPRKAPRQRRAAVTVAAILEATAHILDRGGLEALNTNAVAERAGISIGSLYQYFPGKQALLVALMRADQVAFAAALQAIAAAATSLEDGLRRMVSAAVAHQAARPLLARLLDAEERRLLPAAEIEAAADAIVRICGGFLAQHAPAMPAATRDETARDLVAMARGMIDAPQPGDGLEARVLTALGAYVAARAG